MTVHPIDFQLDRSQNTGEFTYRPFGVASIKIRISSDTKEQPALRLRVRRQSAVDLAEGTFRGYPDNTEALMISWGGGHEPGPCVKPKDFLHFREDPAPLPKGEKSYIYFNLTHIKADELPESAVLTIEAYNPEDDSITSTLSITLKKPPSIPKNLRLVETVPKQKDVWHIQEGDYLQSYDPRWWPEGVAYEAENRPLPLTIRHTDNRLELFWADSADPLAVLTDNTNPSILSPGDHQKRFSNAVLFDLFNFDENHIALRIWFYWLNKQIGGEHFIGRHEVPDSERFDLIIRKDDGAAVFVCTDLHWSEMWGEVAESPLQISLGLSREKILSEIKKKAEDVVDKAWTAPAKWLGFKKDDDEQKVSDAKSPHNPINFIRKRANARYEKEIINQVRDKGSEAHVPQMHGVIEYHRSRFDPTKRNQMVSNDVRLVF
jgi:hypothetical protein